MGKEVKTNAVRILERNKVPYELLTYECDEFIDGIHSAEATGTPVAQTYKTLVMQGKSKKYYVFQTVDKVLRETSVSRSIFLCVYEIYSENRKFSLGLCHP